MNSFSKSSGNQFNTLFLLLTVLLLAFVDTTFGQSISQNNQTSLKIENHTLDSSIVTKLEMETENSNINFLLWFMSTKQDPNAKIAPTSTSIKKQFMTSGVAPNRLLIKSFLKKAVNFDNDLA